jgi:hypothetical protein
MHWSVDDEPGEEPRQNAVVEFVNDLQRDPVEPSAPNGAPEPPPLPGGDVGRGRRTGPAVYLATAPRVSLHRGSADARQR